MIFILQLIFTPLETTQANINQKLERLQKFSQSQLALTSLSKVFAASLSEELICHNLAHRLQEVQGYEFVAVYLVDEKSGNRVLKASVGRVGIPEKQIIEPGIGLSEQPLLDGKLQYTPDVTQNPRYLAGLGQGSEVDVPIKYGNEILGVLVVENSRPQAFNSDDFTLLTSAADQAAIAIKNHRLLMEEKQRRREAEVLRAASVTISSKLDLNQVLDHILIQLGEVVRYDSACIFLLEGNSLQAKSALGLPEPESVIENYFPADNELFQRVLTEKRPIILGDIKDDPRFIGWGGTSAMSSWMGIPLKVGDEIIGILTLDHREKNSFSEEQGELAMIFANQVSQAIQNAQLYSSARSAADKLMVLHEASREITTARFDPERTYQTIHDAATRLMPCEAFCITILDKDNDEIEAAYLVDRDGRSPSVRIPSGQGLSGYVISTGKPLLIHDVHSSEELKGIQAQHFGSPDRIRALIAVPMRLGEDVIGMLSAQSYQPYEYSEEDQKMLEMLAAHAAIAIHNMRLFSRIQYLATVDSLTEVYNRRFFFENANREFARFKRYQHPLSIIMLDLDNYKVINDTFGHVTGDLALKAVAQFIQENIRESDVLGRYGGDEFSLLLPETDLPKALEIAERLRQSVEANEFRTNNVTLKITISIGVASTNDQVTDLAQLLLSADMALYDAKSAGRNCVCSRVWPFPVPSQSELKRED